VLLKFFFVEVLMQEIFLVLKALSDWLLRKVLQLKEGELATIEKLDQLGFDSVIITKTDSKTLKLTL